MKPEFKIAFKAGLIIGLVNLVWLIAGYALGLHTGGLMRLRVFLLIWAVITVTGFVITLHLIQRKYPSIHYMRGVGAGAVCALIAACVAVLAQVVYFKLIHPEWPEVMAKQTREHFTALKLPPEKVEAAVAHTKNYFSLSNYALSSAATTLFLGVALSAVVLLFRPRRAKAPPAAKAKRGR